MAESFCLRLCGWARLPSAANYDFSVTITVIACGRLPDATRQQLNFRRKAASPTNTIRNVPSNDCIRYCAVLFTPKHNSITAIQIHTMTKDLLKYLKP